MKAMKSSWRKFPVRAGGLVSVLGIRAMVPSGVFWVGRADWSRIAVWRRLVREVLWLDDEHRVVEPVVVQTGVEIAITGRVLLGIISPAREQPASMLIIKRYLGICLDSSRVPAAGADRVFDGLSRYGAYGMVLMHGVTR